MVSAQQTQERIAGDGQSVVMCQNLTKVFKDFWLRQSARAVENLTFEVRPREVFGLLGPNGSGKSTTIKIMLGLLHPTSGRVAIFGKSPTDVAVKRRIGYLPEESYLYQFLNARETLDYYAKLFQLDYRTRQRRIDELIDMVGLSGAQFRQVRDYSKGMQRRIGIAQALINDPDFLILDEPTTGLDPVGTRQVKDLIIELGRRGKTILLSSHLLADVEDCVDRMIVLYGGQKREEGTCDSLLEVEDRTTIESDALDEATVAEIDAVIRRRTGGSKSIRRVARPRQKLEEFFLEIVEKARANRIATSGAQAGGPTAAFLLGNEAAQTGESLIEKLTSDAPAPSAAVVQQPAPAPKAPTGPDSDLIGTLTTDKAPGASVREPARPIEQAPMPKAPEADNDMISKLLGGTGGTGGDGASGNSGRSGA
ncbi:MAG: ABC transporter ATP-binding protein [Planctomycetes bacterium]|nr:ABC transporter ATP-binding protein [Planctomycetota bacterium]